MSSSLIQRLQAKLKATVHFLFPQDSATVSVLSPMSAERENGECGVRLAGNGRPIEAPLIAERGGAAGG